MNTLSKSVTRSLLGSDECYTALVRHWSLAVNSERAATLQAAHYLLYLVLRGKDYRRAFGPMTNARKLANGNIEQWGLKVALKALHSRWAEPLLLAPFDGLVTPEMLQRARAVLPTSTAALVMGAYEVQEVALAA